MNEWFGAMDSNCPHEIIGFGAMDHKFPYTFIGAGAMDGDFSMNP